MKMTGSTASNIEGPASRGHDGHSQRYSDSPASYLLAPFLLLMVVLLGGMRLAASDGSFIFLPPELITLVLAALALLLVFRSGVFSFSSWLDAGHPLSKKAANAGIVTLLFIATAQVFNSLLPEKGLMHWAFVFCLLWAIVVAIFAEMPARRVVVNMAVLFAVAFVAKYVVLSGVASPADKTLIERILDDPAREAAGLVLGKQQFSSATGYIQFVTLVFYFWAIWLLRRKPA